MSSPQVSTEIPGPAGPTSNELFRLLVHSVKDYAIFLLDPKGHVASWNEGAQRIKGYAESEIVGQHFSKFYPQAAIDSGWPDHELTVAEKEGRFEDEGWRLRKDGSPFWANVVITALRDESGTLVGFAKVTRDLTERRKAEEELRQSEEGYRMLLNAVRDYAIFMLNPDGFVVTWNAGAQRLKGYEASEIIGQHFSVFYPPERRGGGIPEQELNIARTEGRFEEENWRVRKDGSRFWANVVLAAVRDQAGKLQGFSKVTRDITERHRLELAARQLTQELAARVEELGRTNSALAEKNHEIETFVYSVSHDVRGPLVNLHGFTRETQRSCAELLELIESNTAIAPEVRGRMRQIVNEDIRESTSFMENSVAHLGKMIDALLRLSRLGRVQYECRLVNVVQVVDRVLRSVQGTVDEKGAVITLRELPSVWADPGAIEQIFSNLVANAIRYCDPDRPCRIEIGGFANPAAESVTYFVKDNGLGIPETALPGLFTAFRRFHPAAGPGEGMGLTMVRRMVERHKGKVRVESRVGEGSTFFFELPNSERQL
ncbi:MAG: PAS domain S-box protein [Acidobacteriia bacterium]|nr:PAS domain S-box protein [Terriglobia bacterium]